MITEKEYSALAEGLKEEMLTWLKWHMHENHKRASAYNCFVVVGLAVSVLIPAIWRLWEGE